LDDYKKSCLCEWQKKQKIMNLLLNDKNIKSLFSTTYEYIDLYINIYNKYLLNKDKPLSRIGFYYLLIKECNIFQKKKITYNINDKQEQIPPLD